MIDAPAGLFSHARSSLVAGPASRSSPTSTLPRDDPAASHGRQSVPAVRQVAEAETQTPPSVRDLRRSLIDYSNELPPPQRFTDGQGPTSRPRPRDQFSSLLTDGLFIDYSNRLHPCSEGPSDLLPLATLTPRAQSRSVSEEDNETDGHDPSTANFNGTAVTRKPADKKTNKLCSSLLVRGRHACPTKKKASPPLTPKTKAQDGETKHSRNGIFVFLGLAD